ncbi:FCD domain-containing protein [Streptomyces sp. NPDC091289]|uniref:FCD domain-containing protein n=1 Tax=Streptomyces sp. NPDC091289 TaxID=3365989 RepID=UPI0037F9C43C
MERRRRLPGVLQARKALETKLAELFAERRTEEDLAALRDALAYTWRGRSSGASTVWSATAASTPPWQRAAHSTLSLPRGVHALGHRADHRAPLQNTTPTRPCSIPKRMIRPRGHDTSTGSTGSADGYAAPLHDRSLRSGCSAGARRATATETARPTTRARTRPSMSPRPHRTRRAPCPGISHRP